MTLEEAKNIYYRDYKTRVRAISYNCMTGMIDNILKRSSWILKKDIRDITEDDLIIFKEEALKNYFKNTVRKAMNMIENILIFFQKRGILKKNVVDNIQRIKQEQYELKSEIITEKEFILITDEILKQNEKTISKKEVILFLTLLFKTGLRHSEARALKWKNINFDTGLLYITNSLYCNTYKSYELTETKTPNSRRSIKVNKSLLSALKKHKENSEYIRKEDFIFNYNGFPRIASFGKKELLKAANKIGVKISTHGLRHSHASFLLHNKISILKISRRLGHSNVAITLKIYCHLINENEDDIVELIENI